VPSVVNSYKVHSSANGSLCAFEYRQLTRGTARISSTRQRRRVVCRHRFRLHWTPPQRGVAVPRKMPLSRRSRCADPPVLEPASSEAVRVAGLASNAEAGLSGMSGCPVMSCEIR
jgi:hypothetical protein